MVCHFILPIVNTVLFRYPSQWLTNICQDKSNTYRTYQLSKLLTIQGAASLGKEHACNGPKFS